jgi:hypothetical protein
MRLKRRNCSVYARSDFVQRRKKRSPWQVGPTAKREGEKERVTVQEGDLLGHGPLQWLG